MTSISTPLTQVSPTSLEILFSKPADTLTTEDVWNIVAALRVERGRWNAEQKIKESKPKAEKATKTAAKSTLSLDELDL